MLETAGLLLLALQLCACQTGPLFERMPAEQTGVDFANELPRTDSLTILDFEYKDNGGGVAVGDVNNDSLPDLYFTGNMVSSRLYLNQGNWQFEDVTTSAGVGTKVWANGVTMVDVNQDGFKDIYVCVGGPRGTKPANMANRLFINDGDGTFTEAAAEYGLDDTGYSVQAAFFDYDGDGDLDVYLLQSALVDYNRNAPRPRRTQGEAPSTDKLYRNNGDGTFTDVSEEAGIQTEGFGLGVAIHDVNRDGWPDVYAANDFLTDDLLYINNQDGTFTNRTSQYLYHQSYASMGTDIADFNNDGLADIFVLDMLPETNRRRKLTMPTVTYGKFQRILDRGYQPQYTRNVLQLNNGNGTFSEIGRLAGVHATDWSWSALFADLNNDGYKDLFVTNGVRHDMTNLDLDYSRNAASKGLSGALRQLKLKRLRKLKVKVPNYAFENNGGLTFEDKTKDWGLEERTFSNGAAYADLDNDGDLDLVLNNIDQKAFLYRNRLRETREKANYLQVDLNGPPKNRDGLGTRVSLKYDGKQQSRYLNPVRGYQSSVRDVLHFGLGGRSEVDSLKVRWPDGKTQVLTGISANQHLTIDYAEATEPEPTNSSPDSSALFEAVTDTLGLHYAHRENPYVGFKRQPLLLHTLSRLGPGLAVGDANADGREDLFVGGAAGSGGTLFVQRPDRRERPERSEEVLSGAEVSRMPSWMQSDGSFQPRPGPWQADSLAEDLGTLFFDAEGDGDEDLYVVSGGTARPAGSARYQDRLYLNDGGGRFRQASEALPKMHTSGSCVVGADYNRDGALDLFVCGRVVPGAYPKSPDSYLLRNDSGPDSVRFTPQGDAILPGLPDLGMVTSALWTDFNNDGWVDLVVTGEFMEVRFFRNLGGEQSRQQSGPVRFEEVTDQTGLPPMHGWWNSLAGGDFDRDGDTDYVAGNLGRNTRYRVSSEEPLCVHAKDYDYNGQIDPVASHYVRGTRYPVHTRGRMIMQLPGIASQFPNYASYASARFEEVLSPKERKGAQKLCSERFASSYLENLGGGRFQVRALPVKAQVAPVFGMNTGDYNGDGYLDVLLVGNSYAPPPNTGRYDALIGLLLRGDGEGGFEAVDVRRSGFFVDGDAKGLAEVALGNGRRLLVASRNDGPVKALQTRPSTRKWVAAKPDDAYALIPRPGGRTEKREFYYGHTYLSHSSRGLSLSTAVDTVTIVDYRGNRRDVVLDEVASEETAGDSSPANQRSPARP